MAICESSPAARHAPVIAVADMRERLKSEEKGSGADVYLTQAWQKHPYARYGLPLAVAFGLATWALSTPKAPQNDTKLQ